MRVLLCACVRAGPRAQSDQVSASVVVPLLSVRQKLVRSVHARVCVCVPDARFVHARVCVCAFLCVSVRFCAFVCVCRARARAEGVSCS